MAKLIFSSNEFKEWIKTADKSSIKSYLEFLLLDHKQQKNLLYTLSQVELRSLKIPGINYLNSIFEPGYFLKMNELGFINKYQNFSSWGPKIRLDKKRIIYCDSREKDLVEFSTIKPLIKKLDYGDYAFSNNEWTNNTYIERKSIADFIGTLSIGFKRFIKEIERSKSNNSTLIILVEGNLSDVLDYRNKRIVNYKIRIPPEVIFNNVRKLIQAYPNIQFLFIDNHQQSGEIIERIFALGGQIQKYDLQYLFDAQKLIGN